LGMDEKLNYKISPPFELISYHISVLVDLLNR